MSGGEEGGSARQLDQTPTWAVSLVCAIIVLISIILEKVIHKFAHVLEHKKKAGLLEALEKIKAELMVLGFISLLLTFGQSYIANICIPTKYGNTMLPCRIRSTEAVGGEGGHEEGGQEESVEGGGEGHGGGEDHGGGAAAVATAAAEHHRRLLSYERRFLSGGDSAASCKPGHIPLISVNGLHQLHIFIFFLAVFHVFYSAITMTLGRLKIRGWKEWERDHMREQEAMNDPNRFRLTHEVSFVRDHNSFWTKTPISFYFVCFFRQFFRSVRKADYLTMRHGFVTVHLTPGSKFDFQNYIKRSLEDDFKVVVGISPILWASVVLYLLVNVHGWHASFWVSFLPLIVILTVGTKLQAIITRMALDIQERHAVVQGMPLVQVSDKHFWFEWPPLILYLIHYVLFQNAFELTYVLWIWYEFGLSSCFHEDMRLLVVRIAFGIAAQVVCSYVTLPLYALVTQMGSTMKKSIFDEQTSKAIKKWHQNAQMKKKNSKGRTATQTLGASPPQGETPLMQTTDEQQQLHQQQQQHRQDQQESATIVTPVDL
ncbi:MLO-like protein 9 [Prosopis cineraria]|uniref:MLO-like protein 9 n=1 Tax=Prosopis cineraria TaxID=364024 RepID=UPI00240F073F|nr:MLO-like protein 9 [Prosopis cineraria]